MTTYEARLRRQLTDDGVDPDLVDEIVAAELEVADEVGCY